MVVLELVLYARTQHVEAVRFPADGDWHCKIKCGGCGEEFPKEVTINSHERVEVIKEQVNFQAKCKNCSRKGTVLILPTSAYEAKPDENGNIKSVLVSFDCRGLEITEISVGNSLTVVSSSGTEYKEADFNDLWAEYDDKLGELCQVEDVKTVIVRK